MNKTLFEMLISTLIGSTVIVGGITMSSQDIIDSATSVTNSANMRQIATVLELYYSDHQRYPLTTNGEDLIDELMEQDYLRARPLDESVLRYAPKSNGQDYSLALDK